MLFKSYFQVDSESKGEAKEKGKAAKGDLVKGPLEDLGKAVSDLFSFVEEHNKVKSWCFPGFRTKDVQGGADINPRVSFQLLLPSLTSNLVFYPLH